MEFPFYSPKTIQEVLGKYETKPKKSLGQNFLIDKNIVDRFFDDFLTRLPRSVQSLGEIGMGLGAFTHRLVLLPYPLYLFELDETLIQIFKETMEGSANKTHSITLFQGNCLDYLNQLNGKATYLLGNLPYYLTSDILSFVIKNILDLQGFTFLVQKEFGYRVVKEVSSFSVFLHCFGSFELSKPISSNCFYPSPKVESTFLYYQPNPLPGLDPMLQNPIQRSKNIIKLEALLRIAFWGKRKKLSTVIKKAPNSFYSHLENSNEYIEVLNKIFHKKNWLDKRPDGIPIPKWRETIHQVLTDFD